MTSPNNLTTNKSISKPHTNLGDSLDHIFDMTADRPHSSDFLLGAEPFFHLDRLWVLHVDVDGQVTERAAKNSSRSTNADPATLGRDRHTLRHLHRLIYHDLLHPPFVLILLFFWKFTKLPTGLLLNLMD